MVQVLLCRYLPAPYLDWDRPELERAAVEAADRIRRGNKRIRERVRLQAEGVVVDGAELVLAARALNLRVVPASWVTAVDQTLFEPSPLWVLFEHRLEWEDGRTFCHCGYTYQPRVRDADKALHPHHLAEVLFVAGMLSPIVNVVDQAEKVLAMHTGRRHATEHVLMIQRCSCGVPTADEQVVGEWLHHRVEALQEAGLLFNPKLRGLIR